MLACHAVRDLPGYYRLNYLIHDAINKAARNDVLRQTYTTINSRLQALRFRSNFDREKWDTAVREHCAMIEALEARDGARLSRRAPGACPRQVRLRADPARRRRRGQSRPSDRFGIPSGPLRLRTTRFARVRARPRLATVAGNVVKLRFVYQDRA